MILLSFSLTTWKVRSELLTGMDSLTGVFVVILYTINLEYDLHIHKHFLFLILFVRNCIIRISETELWTKCWQWFYKGTHLPNKREEIRLCLLIVSSCQILHVFNHFSFAGYILFHVKDSDYNCVIRISETELHTSPDNGSGWVYLAQVDPTLLLNQAVGIWLCWNYNFQFQ